MPFDPVTAPVPDSAGVILGVRVYHCKRCHRSWMPRKPKGLPRACPGCHNITWNIPYRLALEQLPPETLTKIQNCEHCAAGYGLLHVPAPPVIERRPAVARPRASLLRAAVGKPGRPKIRLGPGYKWSDGSKPKDSK